MRRTHYFCDRCEADIGEAPRSALRACAGPLTDRQADEPLDLCADGAQALLAWLGETDKAASATPQPSLL